MTETKYNGKTPTGVFEGSPERPGKPRHVWTIDNLVVDTDGDEAGYFYLVQRVAGTWVQVEDPSRPWQVRWEPRESWLPPITRLTRKRLDDSGSIVD